MGAVYAATSLAGLLCVAPEIILYEHKLYYEGLVAWWLVIGFYGLHRHLTTGRAWPAGLAFVAFAAVVLTRSAFHPVWIFGLAALVLLMRQGWAPRVVVAVCLPLALVGAVMAKNQWMFGTSSLSSWGGINLAKMSVGSLAPDARHQLLKLGRLSVLSSVEPFSSPATYVHILGAQARTGQSAVDAVTKTSGFTNFNHGVYVPVGKAMMHDALAGLRAYPQAFMSRFAASIYHFNRPPSEFKGLEKNLTRMATYDRAFSLVVRGQPAAFFGSALDAGRPTHLLAQVGIWSVALLALCGLAVGAGLVSGVRYLRRRSDGAAVWFICLAFTLAYAVTVVNAFDTWENNRARFMLEPLIVLSVLWLFARVRARAARVSAPAGGGVPVEGDGVSPRARWRDVWGLRLVLRRRPRPDAALGHGQQREQRQ